MHTLSEENYLKAIYRLAQGPNEKITPTAIAESLGNNPASVIDMLKKLTEKQLIHYDKSRGARLTDRGAQAALEVVRKHRLWEVFLQEKLGYGWDEVHDIAEELEHIHHPDLAERLARYLGYPDYDPHGDPIPDAKGRMASLHRITLSELGDGRTCRVMAVRDASSAFLQYLQKLDIGIGTRLKVVEKIGFDGSLVLQVGKGHPVTVSEKFADGLLVKTE
ncbi:metal-dependent transcriptional regulator [Compostibacter hankyongensis]|uniref:Transcriptional regulator MntR n=1 Tax=Compostibacter hankyongensis TaxID=1007089 RepID=A0ABP8GA96_9BACT